MAYSNVGTPVFYVDNCLYHKTIGTDLYDPSVPQGEGTLITPHNEPSLYTLNPAVAKDFTGNMNY